MKPNAQVAQEQRTIFANNLKYYMELAHKDQIDLVRELGVTSSTVSDWANGKKYPRVDKMQAIADYLGVFLSDLREKRSDKEKPTTVPDDGLLKQLVNDPDRLMLARWICSLNEEQLQIVVELLEAARLLPKE